MLRGAVVGLFGLAGCIRDLGDLRTPAEGAALTGEVAERDLSTGEVVPKGGVRVRIRAGSTSFVTGDDGRFVLGRLPLGEHEVIAERKDDRGAVVAARRRRATLLSDGQAQDLGRLVLSLDGTLSGLVVSEGPDVPGGRAPAEGALVAVPGTPYQAVASASGFFLPNLPPGSYDLAAFFPGRAPGLRFGLEVPEGQQIFASEIVLPLADESPVTVAARVSLEGAEDGSSAGTEVRFASVLTGAETETGTDDAGAFTLDLPPGLYRARFDRDGYIPAQLFGIAVLPGGVAGLEPVHLARTLPGDLDGDGVPDVIDPDIDGDGCPNATDDNPRDPLVCRDTDGDGIPDEIDPDIDGDTLSNAEEDSLGLDGWITDPRNPDTEGDGIPDAEDPCPTIPGTECGAAQADVSLVVAGFSPESIATGEAIEIRGQGFDPAATLVRFTGDIALIPALSATATLAVVRVPPGASSGPLQVFARGQAAVTERPLEVFERPTVQRVVPESATLGTLLAVYLTGVDSASTVRFRLDDGPVQPGSPCLEPQREAALGGEWVVCVVPNRRASRLRVLLPTATLEVSLLVQEGPVVTTILPNPAAVGVQLRLLGSNLDAPSEVRVGFPGVPESVVADRVTSGEIAVTVPSGATPGPLTIFHPALEFRTAPVLDMDSDLVLATDLQPLYLTPGDTEVLITGSNLDRVADVLLPDGSSAENLSLTQGTGLRFDVPAAFDPIPGPLTLILNDGSRLTSQVVAGAVRPLSVAPGTRDFYSYFGRVVPLSGQRLGLLGGGSSPREISTLDMVSGSLLTRPVQVDPGYSWVPIRRTSRLLGYQSMGDQTQFTTLDLATSQLGPATLAEVPRGVLRADFGDVSWIGDDLLVIAISFSGQWRFLVIDPRNGSSRWVDVPEINLVFGIDRIGRDLLVVGRFAGLPLNLSGWAIVNVAPDDGIPDGTVVRGPFVPRSLQGSSNLFAEARGDGVLIVSNRGVELARPQGNQVLRRWGTSISQPPALAGGRYFIYPDDLGRGQGCGVFDAVADRVVAVIRRTLNFRCSASGPRAVFSVIGIDGEARSYELLPP